MAMVESSQPLSIESFSYSWLIHRRPSLESFSESFRAAMDPSDESFFIEMDPNMPASKRLKKLERDFDSTPAFSDQPTAASVHAEELFSDGLLMPFVNPSRNPPTIQNRRDSSLCSFPMSEFQNRYVVSGDHKMRCSSLRRCRSLLSRKMLDKYVNFLRPFLSKIRFCRSKSKGRADGDGIWVVQNKRPYSPKASPRSSTGLLPGDQRWSCDAESAIHDAVLHCKKSIGM